MRRTPTRVSETSLSGTVLYSYDDENRLIAVQQGADAWALISHSEGLPVAALEALGAGLPCVLSDECNLPEVGDHGAGWVVNPDVEAATDALSELLANPAEARARGDRARQLVAERFTWDRIAEQTINVYERMVDDRLQAGGIGES